MQLGHTGQCSRTLAEVMVAILFLSIAMSGYFALHLRIIHSSFTLNQRPNMRRPLKIVAAGVLFGAIPPKPAFSVFTPRTPTKSTSATFRSAPRSIHLNSIALWSS